ncbi:RpnC/YadD family protein [Paenibacillus tyrfis]|uniref:hypothetical protein n=1 Tax=Paenibacillus tyrfis TaxID=1501230 RepID=UPI00068F5C34|nr:hypothetical protein [Paenibacillus tyrfis]
MRKKALLDEQSALDYAESRGRAEGRLEGKLEGKLEGTLEIAANMLQKGLPVSLIAEVTGLSEMEIEALNKKLH